MTTKTEITSPDWAERPCYLHHADSGDPCYVGEIVTTPEGEQYKLRGGRAPHKESSSGKVWVVIADDNRSGLPMAEREYYPGVFNLCWSRI